MSIHLLYRQETQSHSIRFGRKSCRLCWQITLYKKAKKSPSCSEIISSIISWVSRHNKKVIWPFGLCIYLYILAFGHVAQHFFAGQWLQIDKNIKENCFKSERLTLISERTKGENHPFLTSYRQANYGMYIVGKYYIHS